MKVKVTFFAAQCGDSFLIECPIGGRIFRVLVDAGIPATGTELIAYLKGSGTCVPVDLLIVTHIDNDHIGGVLTLLNDAEVNRAIKEIWFNGYGMLAPSSTVAVQSLSVGQGIELEARLLGDPRWNACLGQGPVCLNDDGSPRTIKLDDGVSLDILSPGSAQLHVLKTNWERVVADMKNNEEKKFKFPAGIRGLSPNKNVDALADAKFDKDRAFANGSSIAFLLRVNDCRLLFTGDAFAEVVSDAADKLQIGPISLDVFKISHHGSEGNTDKRIVEKFPAEHYFISTDGRHDHPHDEAIARILVGSRAPKTIHFNYPGVLRGWEATDFAGRWSCITKFGDGKNPIILELP